MKCRVVSQCYQPLGPGEPHRFLKVGRIVNWEGNPEKLPPCFESLDKSGAISTGFPTEEKPKPQTMMESDRTGQILMAEDRLDHGNPNLWTKRGTIEIPTVEAVREQLKKLGFDDDVTRAEIHVANPGFVRKPPKWV